MLNYSQGLARPCRMVPVVLVGQVTVGAIEASRREAGVCSAHLFGRLSVRRRLAFSTPFSSARALGMSTEGSAEPQPQR